MVRPALRSRAWLARAVAGLVGSAAWLLASAAYAATEAPAEHAGGLPQLDVTTYPSQIVWLAVTFVVLCVLMTRVALPRVASVLKEREDRVSSDLDRATVLRNQAAEILAAYEQALGESRAGAQRLQSEAGAEMAEAAAARQHEASAALATKLSAAEANIAAAKTAALGNVAGVAAEVVQATTAKLTGIEVPSAAAARAVATVLQEVG